MEGKPVVPGGLHPGKGGGKAFQEGVAPAKAEKPARRALSWAALRRMCLGESEEGARGKAWKCAAGPQGGEELVSAFSSLPSPGV